MASSFERVFEAESRGHRMKKELEAGKKEVVCDELHDHVRHTGIPHTYTAMWYKEDGKERLERDLDAVCKCLQARNPGYWCKPMQISRYSGFWVGWDSRYWLNAIRRLSA